MKKIFCNCVFIVIVFSILSSCNKDELSGSITEVACEDTNCADYSSRYEAQLDFDWNRECRADLDADKDGLACEDNHWTDYYNSISTTNGGGNGGGSGCPTTANCGCSGLNKSPCESNVCCRWIVGTGCRCD